MTLTNPKHLHDRLEYFIRSHEQVCNRLHHVRRWPWRKRERIQLEASRFRDLLAISVLNLGLHKRDAAKSRFEETLSAIHLYLELVPRYRPGLGELYAVSGGLVCGSTEIAAETAKRLLPSFDEAPRPLRKGGHVDDHLASEDRRHGIGAVLWWIAGDENRAAFHAEIAGKLHDTEAYLEGALVGACVAAASQSSAVNLENALNTLLSMVQKQLKSGNPSYGETHIVYTPAIAVIRLAKSQNLCLPVFDYPVSPRWLQSDE